LREELEGKEQHNLCLDYFHSHGLGILLAIISLLIFVLHWPHQVIGGKTLRVENDKPGQGSAVTHY
jgi:hypothetical protein